jgi:hypothetical protein
MTKNRKEIIRKTIPFGPAEQELYKYAIEQCNLQGIKFATYVKKLIRDAKNNTSLDSVLEKKLDKYFKNKNVSINKNDTGANTNTKYKKEDKSALLNFLKK